METVKVRRVDLIDARVHYSSVTLDYMVGCKEGRIAQLFTGDVGQVKGSNRLCELVCADVVVR